MSQMQLHRKILIEKSLRIPFEGGCRYMLSTSNSKKNSFRSARTKHLVYVLP